MSPTEQRVATVLTLVVLASGSVRYGLEFRPQRPLLPDSTSALDSLLAANDSALAEREARERPLEPGERIDPNAASTVDLDRIPGVGPGRAAAIVEERERGGAFRSVEDLARVAGIGPATAGRLAPYVDLPSEGRGAAKGARIGGRNSGGTASPDPRRPATSTVDVNRASPEELVALPGIGPAIAVRIVRVRDERGRFLRLEDLLEVPGIGPSRLERIRERVRLGR